MSQPAPQTGHPSWRRHPALHLTALVVLVLLWLALWGSISVGLILAGTVLAAVVLIVFPLPPMALRYRPQLWPMIVLVTRFAADVVVASLHVSYLALRPARPATDVVVAQLATESDLIQHLTALAVSLVPGSLIIDADPDRRTLTIHVLYSRPQPPDEFLTIVLAQEHRIAAALGYRPASAGRDDL